MIGAGDLFVLWLGLMVGNVIAAAFRKKHDWTRAAELSWFQFGALACVWMMIQMRRHS